MSQRQEKNKKIVEDTTQDERRQEKRAEIGEEKRDKIKQVRELFKNKGSRSFFFTVMS